MTSIIHLSIQNLQPKPYGKHHDDTGVASLLSCSTHSRICKKVGGLCVSGPKSLCNQQTQFQLSFPRENELHGTNTNTKYGDRISWEINALISDVVSFQNCSNRPTKFKKVKVYAFPALKLARTMALSARGMERRRINFRRRSSCERVSKSFGFLVFFLAKILSSRPRFKDDSADLNWWQILWDVGSAFLLRS